MTDMTVSEREALLSNWIKRSSDDETKQQERAEGMVKEAVMASSDLVGVSKRIYAKGSYANNTNVRRDSDVDIVVQCQECVFDDYLSGVEPATLSILPRYEGKWTTGLWRSTVVSALQNKFGSGSIDTTGNIAIKIAAVPGSRPSIDVVPSFDYRRYDNSSGSLYSDGSCVWTKNGHQVVNWPDQQHKNGNEKNVRTGGRYKYFVRALKNSENFLVSNKIISAKPSYFMECLVWNVSDYSLKAGTLEQGFRATLVELWEGLGDQSKWNEWEEPNKLKYLFRGQNKWSDEDGRELVLKTWEMMGY